MFKFELGQVVFYLENNIMHSAPIMSRVCVENLHDDWACTKEQKEFWQRFGRSDIKYVTVHGVYSERQLFSSSMELSKSLTSIGSDLY
jgi:hypothetical protein